MRKVLATCTLLITFNISHSQFNGDTKFSPSQLKEDLAYLKQQIFHVHAMPYSELSEKQYETLFTNIESQLKDSLSATTFLQLVKPVMAYLSDEHSNIGLKKELLSTAFRSQPVCLPFSVTKKNNQFFVQEIIGNNLMLKKGMLITAINNIPVTTWITDCALRTTGFPSQRFTTAMTQFGYRFAFANETPDTTFLISTGNEKNIRIAGTTIAAWKDYTGKNSLKTDCQERLHYQRFNNTSYINACSFDVQQTGPYSMKAIKSKIDSIFDQIQRDRVKTLIIDVSNNTGGNSAVGNYLIEYFYNKPYKDYQCNWKRSDEYLRLLRSWGIDDTTYAQMAVGSVMHFPPDTIVPPQEKANRFTGKVVVIIGKRTFSSAMLFGTLVMDNHLAPLYGQVPEDGHPNGFGEVYNTNLPNTQIQVLLGVKEWIRPAGKGKDNLLHPDVLLTDEEMRDVRLIVKKVEG